MLLCWRPPTSVDPARIRGLNAGLVKVQKIRRRFRRTERDAAYVALASGVAGAGPFVISQGALLFRRVGLNFAMAPTTGKIRASFLATLDFQIYHHHRFWRT